MYKLKLVFYIKKKILHKHLHCLYCIAVFLYDFYKPNIIVLRTFALYKYTESSHFKKILKRKKRERISKTKRDKIILVIELQYMRMSEAITAHMGGVRVLEYPGCLFNVEEYIFHRKNF